MLTLQLQLVRRLPFCLAQLLGTHNSAISLADGYGNRDEYFQQYFKWIRWVVGTYRLDVVVQGYKYRLSPSVPATLRSIDWE